MISPSSTFHIDNLDEQNLLLYRLWEICNMAQHKHSFDYQGAPVSENLQPLARAKIAFKHTSHHEENVFYSYNKDLILKLILIKRDCPDHPFFYGEGLRYETKNKVDYDKELTNYNAQLKNLAYRATLAKEKNNTELEKMLSEENKELTEKMTKLFTKEETDKKSFYNFIKQAKEKHTPHYLGLSDNDPQEGIENGLFLCWKYYKKALVIKGIKKIKDPREWVLKMINSIPQRVLESDFISFFDKISQFEKTNIDSFSKFVSRFVKEKNIKSLYSSNPRYLYSLPGSLKTSTLLYSKDTGNEKESDFLKRGGYNRLNLFLQSRRRKNYLGWFFLKNTIEKPNVEIYKDTEVSYEEYINNVIQDGAEHDFINKKFDLAILELDGFSSSRRITRTPDLAVLYKAMLGVKEGGYVFLKAGSFQKGSASRFLEMTYMRSGVKEPSFLPESIIAFKSSSWIVLKNTKSKKELKIVNAKNCYKNNIEERPTGRISRHLDEFSSRNRETIAASKLIRAYFERNKNSKKLNIDTFFNKHGASLNTDRYFMPKYKGQPLTLILKELKGTLINKKAVGKIVDIMTLKRGFQGLDLEKIENINIIPPRLKQRTGSYTRHLRKISKSCLLISPRLGNLSPAWFSFQGTSIYIRDGIMALEPVCKSEKEKETLGLYLQHKLEDSVVKEQLEFLKRGNTLMTYSREDIMNNLLIEVPTIKEQEQLIERKRQEIISKLKQQLEKVEEKANKNYKDDFDWLEHKINKTLESIDGFSEIINVFFAELPPSLNNGVKKEFSKRYPGDKFEDFLKRIEKGPEKIKNSILLAAKRAQLDEQLKYIECAKIVEVLKKYKERSLNHDVDVSVDIDLDLIEKFSEANKTKACLFVNQEGLEFVIDEIISNARKYGGFTELKKGKILVSISKEDELEPSLNNKKNSEPEDPNELTDGSIIIITVENNGEAMPKNFGKKEFVEKNLRGNNAKNKEGDGLGGSYVGLYADKFCEEWELINDPGQTFKVKFIFKFRVYEKPQ